MTDWPVVGGYTVGALIVIAGMIRFFFADHKAFDVFHEEIRMLRETQDKNTREIAAIRTLYDEQRREKHSYINKYARTRILLSVVDRLSEQCTCGALANVRDLIDQALDEDDE